MGREAEDSKEADGAVTKAFGFPRAIGPVKLVCGGGYCSYSLRIDCRVDDAPKE